MSENPDGTDNKASQQPEASLQNTNSATPQPPPQVVMFSPANFGQGLPYAPNFMGGLPAGLLQVSVAQQVTQQSWQGPFPPPEAAERFEMLVPGAFNRIIIMAEQAQTAQILSVDNAQNFARRDTRRGHYLGFISNALAMFGAIFCLYLKFPWVSVSFLSVPAMAVGKALVDSAHKSKDENIATRVTMPPTATSANTLPTPATPDEPAPHS